MDSLNKEKETLSIELKELKEERNQVEALIKKALLEMEVFDYTPEERQLFQTGALMKSKNDSKLFIKNKESSSKSGVQEVQFCPRKNLVIIKNSNNHQVRVPYELVQAIAAYTKGGK